MDDENLPPGFEKQVDNRGRTFYIDHNTQSTHWKLPEGVGQQSPAASDQRMSSDSAYLGSGVDEFDDDSQKLPTEFIIKGERLTTLIGLGDDVPSAASDFVEKHSLSESLLHTIERELWTTQLELSRRFIADRMSDIERLTQRTDAAALDQQKVQRRISELESALVEERTHQSNLDTSVRQASESMCAILGTNFGDGGSMPSLKQLVDAVAVRHDMRESKIAAVERESEVLREQQGQSHRQLQNLKQNLDAVKAGLDEAKQHARQSELQAIEQHQAVLQERDAHAGRLQAQCDRLSADLEQRMAALDVAQEAALRAEQVAEDYAKKHELMKHNIREATSQKQTWQARISTLTHENKQQQAKLDEREVQNQKLQARVLDATTELRKLQRAIGTALATATATGQRVTILEGALRGAVDVRPQGMPSAKSMRTNDFGDATPRSSYTEMTGFASPRQMPRGAGVPLSGTSISASTTVPAGRGASPTREAFESAMIGGNGNVATDMELSHDQQVDMLKHTFELFANMGDYNGQHQMPLSKFKKHLGKEELNVVDEKKLKTGDIDVVFHQALSKTVLQPARSTQNDRMMNFDQFLEAMRIIASKLYAPVIERMTGKKINALGVNEKAAAIDAAQEVFCQRQLAPFLNRKISRQLPGLEAMVQSNTAQLSTPPSVRQLEVQLLPFSQIYSYYSESQRAKGNKTNMQLRRAGVMTYKELIGMLTDFRVVPKLKESSAVSALWGFINRRDGDGQYRGITDLLKAANRPRTPQALAEQLTQPPVPDFFNLPQFIEILGHIALENMPHLSTKARLSALFKFLDGSDGNTILASKRSMPVIRFSTAS